MRAAPPVHMASGPDPRWGVAVAAWAAVSATTLLTWLSAHAALAPLAVLALGLSGGAAAGALAWWRTRCVPVRHLHWDGRIWTLDELPGRVELRLDAGHWLLLYWRDATGGCWLPLSPGRCGAPASGVRAALRAHATDPASAAADGLAPHG